MVAAGTPLKVVPLPLIGAHALDEIRGEHDRRGALYGLEIGSLGGELEPGDAGDAHRQHEHGDQHLHEGEAALQERRRV
jgi:hypothetical protein